MKYFLDNLDRIGQLVSAAARPRRGEGGLGRGLGDSAGSWHQAPRRLRVSCCRWARAEGPACWAEGFVRVGALPVLSVDPRSRPVTVGALLP